MCRCRKQTYFDGRLKSDTNLSLIRAGLNYKF